MEEMNVEEDGRLGKRDWDGRLWDQGRVDDGENLRRKNVDVGEGQDGRKSR